MRLALGLETAFLSIAVMESIEGRLDEAPDVGELFLDVTLSNALKGSVEWGVLTSIPESGSSGSLLVVFVAGISRERTKGSSLRLL